MTKKNYLYTYFISQNIICEEIAGPWTRPLTQYLKFEILVEWKTIWATKWRKVDLPTLSRSQVREDNVINSFSAFGPPAHAYFKI